MLDFSHGSGLNFSPPTLSDKINAAIDEALIARRANEPPRTYLGASEIGHPCSRKLVYSYTKTPVDPERELTGRQLRIFDTGHAAEDYAAEQMSPMDGMVTRLAAKWLFDAGFLLVTHDADNKQFGFSAMDGKYQGHIDGILRNGPTFDDELKYPGGWEHKGLNAKSWQNFKKHGVKIASDVYYVQMQQYMAYMDLDWFLFTATNKNTSEMHHEKVEFDGPSAQLNSDRAVEIINAAENNVLLPRVTDNPDFYKCLWCDWRGRCWEK